MLCFRLKQSDAVFLRKPDKKSPLTCSGDFFASKASKFLLLFKFLYKTFAI